MAEEKESLIGCVAQMQNENARFLGTSRIDGPYYSPEGTPSQVDLTVEGRSGASIRFFGTASGIARAVARDGKGARAEYAVTASGDVSRDTLGDLPKPNKVGEAARGLADSFNRCLR
jgi:hypothetical protein